MSIVKVLIIHVGNMNNKGTQALLTSDVNLIKNTLEKDITFSVSTTDVEGVKRLLPSAVVFGPMLDIPYERADFYARRLTFSRASWKYKAFVVAGLILMPAQMTLSTLSAVLVRFGLRPLCRGDFLRNLKKCDLVVSYSDENFKEGASMLPSNVYWVLTWWTMLVSRTWDVLTAKFLKKKLVMFPNSVGPFTTLIGRSLARLALNRYDCILVRESKSYRAITSLGIRTPKILTSDTTLTLNTDSKFSSRKFQRPIVGVSVGVYSLSLTEKGFDNFVESVSGALDTAIEKHGFSVVFLPHYVSGFAEDDVEISKLIQKHMRNKDRAEILNASSVEDYKYILGQMDIVVSSKMHPCVLAAASYVPVVSIAYDDKQIGFFEQLNLTDYVLPLKDLSGEILASKIDYTWSTRHQIEAELRRKIPVLQGGIRIAAKRVLTGYVARAGSTHETSRGESA